METVVDILRASGSSLLRKASGRRGPKAVNQPTAHRQMAFNGQRVADSLRSRPTPQHQSGSPPRHTGPRQLQVPVC